jgi:plasmid stabilization system protein ParE
VVIIWSHPAREDLRLIHQQIAHDSKQYATRVVNGIMERMDILPTAPRMGRMVPEIGEPDVREISLYSWRIMYEIVGDALYVHGVIHKRRDFKPEDLQR